VLVEHGEDGLPAGADGVGVSDATQPVVGGELDEDGLLLEERLNGVCAHGLHMLTRYAVAEVMIGVIRFPIGS
jgi:hypothetical protein